MPLPVRRRDAAPQPVVRWDPFREIEGLQEQLAQVMRGAGDGNGGTPFVPLADIEETAKLHEGVLTIRIPKPDQQRPRRINVKRG